MFIRPRKRPWQNALGPGGTQHSIEAGGAGAGDAASTRGDVAYAYGRGSSPALSAESASRPLNTAQLPLAATPMPSYAPSSTISTAATASALHAAAATAIVLSGSTETNSSDKRSYPCRTCHAHFSSSSNRLRHERAKHKASEDRQLHEHLTSGVSVADSTNVQLQHVASARPGVAAVVSAAAAASESVPSAAAASGAETDMIQDLTAPEGDETHEETLASNSSAVLSSSSAVSSSNDAHMAPLTALPGTTASATSVRHWGYTQLSYAAQLVHVTGAREVSICLTQVDFLTAPVCFIPGAFALSGNCA